MTRLPALEYMLATYRSMLPSLSTSPARHAHRAEVARPVGEVLFAERAVAVVEQQHAVAEFVDDVEVGPAVVVGVQPDGAEGGPMAAAGRRSRPVTFSKRRPLPVLCQSWLPLPAPVPSTHDDAFILPAQVT